MTFARGISVHSPMPIGSGAILVHRALEASIPSYRVQPYRPVLQYFPPLLAGLKDGSARIVHSTPDQGDLVLSRGQAFVVTFHNFVLDAYMRPYSAFTQRLHYASDLKWLTRRAIRKAATITAVSRFTADRVEEFFSLTKPVTVIPNGVDAGRFGGDREMRVDGVVRVLVSGNASLRKGTHWLGDIARQLEPGIEIMCTVGAEQLARWVPGMRNIRPIGRRSADAMPELYRSVDILLLPTVREGLSLAVLEAMAAGLPVVASANSSMPELVHDNLGGRLCETGNVVEYAAAINRLAADENLRRRMGDYNRARISNEFRVDTMVSRYREVFSAISQ